MSRIEKLNISGCSNLGNLIKYPFKKMFFLKEINIARLPEGFSFCQEDGYFLDRFEILNMGFNRISSRTFSVIQSCCMNLKELFLCWAEVNDGDLNLNSRFPVLETICLTNCSGVTCEGIVSLIKSCQSIQNVYVNKGVAESYRNHSFTSANRCKLTLVKVIDSCNDHEKKNFFI